MSTLPISWTELAFDMLFSSFFSSSILKHLNFFFFFVGWDCQNRYNHFSVRSLFGAGTAAISIQNYPFGNYKQFKRTNDNSFFFFFSSFIANSNRIDPLAWFTLEKSTKIHWLNSHKSKFPHFILPNTFNILYKLLTSFFLLYFTFFYNITILLLIYQSNEMPLIFILYS